MFLSSSASCSCFIQSSVTDSQPEACAQRQQVVLLCCCTFETWQKSEQPFKHHPFKNVPVLCGQVCCLTAAHFHPFAFPPLVPPTPDIMATHTTSRHIHIFPAVFRTGTETGSGILKNGPSLSHSIIGYPFPLSFSFVANITRIQFELPVVLHFYQIQPSAGPFPINQLLSS